MAEGAGTATVGATWWVTTSRQRAARLLRRLAADARRSVLPAPAKPNPNAWSDNQITVSWLGHSTALINFYGIRILTDPVFGARCGVSLGLGVVGPKRYIAPALSLKELPPIDVVLLSHGHMDHLDFPSLRRLPRTAFAATAKATGDLLNESRLKNFQELAWGEATTFQNSKGKLELKACEVKHWGERWPSKLPRGYNGYVLRREGKALLVGSDTAETPMFR